MTRRVQRNAGGVDVQRTAPRHAGPQQLLEEAEDARRRTPGDLAPGPSDFGPDSAGRVIGHTPGELPASPFVFVDPRGRGGRRASKSRVARRRTP